MVHPPCFLSLVHTCHSWLLSVSNPQLIIGKSWSTTTKPPTSIIPHHLSTTQIQAKFKIEGYPCGNICPLYIAILMVSVMHIIQTPKHSQRWQYLFDLTNSFTLSMMNIVVILILWLNPLMQCRVAHNVHWNRKEPCTWEFVFASISLHTYPIHVAPIKTIQFHNTPNFKQNE